MNAGVVQGTRAPALGTPMIPASATSLSSRLSQMDAPSSPSSAMMGALLVDVLNDALPRPLRPPCTSSALSPASPRVPVITQSVLDLAALHAHAHLLIHGFGCVTRVWICAALQGRRTEWRMPLPEA